MDREREAQRRRVGWPEPHSRGQNGTPGHWARITPTLQEVRWPDSAQGLLAEGAPSPGRRPFPGWPGSVPMRRGGCCPDPRHGGLEARSLGNAVTEAQGRFQAPLALWVTLGLALGV